MAFVWIICNRPGDRFMSAYMPPACPAMFDTKSLLRNIAAHQFIHDCQLLSTRCPTLRTKRPSNILLQPQTTYTWPMEDHLCPRLVQPKAACLSCLSRPQPQKQSKGQRTPCSNRINTLSTNKAQELSHQSQVPAKTTLRTNYAVQPPSQPSHLPQNTIRHIHDLDLDKSSVNIASTAIAVPVHHPCETCPLYARLMKRYTAIAPWSTPINSRRALPMRR